MSENAKFCKGDLVIINDSDEGTILDTYKSPDAEKFQYSVEIDGKEVLWIQESDIELLERAPSA